MTMQRKFFASAIAQDSALGPRQIKVIACSGELDRDGDITLAEGCLLEDYERNPIVLFNHNPGYPVGTAKVSIREGRVEALIDFAPEGASKMADEVCAMAKGGVLNAVSIGFNPVISEPLKGGRYVYKQWSLLELSIVSVPADPKAVIVSRSLSHDEGMGKSGARWKCGASRSLPVSGKESWDGDAAKARIFAKAGFGGKSPDYAWARKGFLAYDSSAPEEKGSYKLPFADVIDGRLTAVAGGIRAAASRLPQADIPEDVRAKGRAVLDDYEARMKESKSAPAAAWKSGRPRIKGLYHVARLAAILEEMGWQCHCASAEAAFEEDGSQVPVMLAGALRSLSDAFLAMTAEEVFELLSGVEEELAEEEAGGEGADIEEDESLPAAAKAVRRAFRKAGRAISGENAKCLESAMKCMKAAIAQAEEAHGHIEGLMQKAMADNGNGGGEDAGAGDAEKKISALRRKRLAEVLALSAPP